MHAATGQSVLGLILDLDVRQSRLVWSAVHDHHLAVLLEVVNDRPYLVLL